MVGKKKEARCVDKKNMEKFYCLESPTVSDLALGFLLRERHLPGEFMWQNFVEIMVGSQIMLKLQPYCKWRSE